MQHPFTPASLIPKPTSLQGCGQSPISNLFMAIISQQGLKQHAGFKPAQIQVSITHH